MGLHHQVCDSRLGGERGVREPALRGGHSPQAASEGDRGGRLGVRGGPCCQIKYILAQIIGPVKE